MIKINDQVQVLDGNKKRFIGVVSKVNNKMVTITLHHNNKIIEVPMDNVSKYPTEERNL